MPPWWRRPRWRSLLLVALVAGGLTASMALARLLTDSWWFQEVGQGDVHQRILLARLELFLTVGALAATALLATAWLAAALAPTPIGKGWTATAIVVSLVLAVVVGYRAAADWQSFLLWQNGGSFGAADSIRHRDLGYFVFTLPFERKVEGLAGLALGLCTLMAVGVHYAGESIQTEPLRVHRPARVHLVALLGVAALLLAWHLRLEAWTAEIQDGPSSYPGPHYVDVHVRIPGLGTLATLAVLAAAAQGVAAVLLWHRRDRAAYRIIAIGLGGVATAVLALQFAAPWVVQRVVVGPQGLAKERTYLRAAVTATRSGFGLDAIRVTPIRFASDTGLPPAAARQSLANVQLWDTGMLTRWMKQLDSVTPYYRAHQLSSNAPVIRGRPRMTVVAARDIDASQVGGSATRWINNRLVYTHGYGVVRVSATRASAAGRPVVAKVSVPVTQPRIYFGRRLPGAARWVVANTARAEADRPGTKGGGYHYAGKGGVQLTDPLRRLAFAVRLHNLTLLFGGEILARSRVMLHTDVLDRLRSLAPFLQWDRHPSTIVVGGRVVFLADGYTTSATFPGGAAATIAGVRATYARAAVRATVDAFSGAVHLYVTRGDDPIVRAWSRTFPTLFSPLKSMPAGVRQQLRYPRELFDLQARLYERFHQVSAAAFSSQADRWAPPTRLSGSVSVAGRVRFDDDNNANPTRPSYRLGAPAGEATPRLVRSALFSPSGAQNLVATLDGWIDDDGQPRLSARRLPPDVLTLGPAQMARLVLLAPKIADRLGLLNRETADLSRDSLEATSLGVPRDVFLPSGVLQAQPVYVESSGGGISRMIGVTVYYNGHVGLGKTVRQALADALRPRPSVRFSALPASFVVGKRSTIGFDVSSGLTETLAISSKRGVERSRSFTLRSGRGEADWIPKHRGPHEIRVTVRGEGAEEATAVVTVRVRAAPKRKPHRRRPRKRSPAATTPLPTQPPTPATTPPSQQAPSTPPVATSPTTPVSSSPPAAGELDVGR